LGFSDEPEATYFYGQALSEVGVIAATDWDGNTEDGGAFTKFIDSGAAPVQPQGMVEPR
jgi:hypothetical protein